MNFAQTKFDKADAENHPSLRRSYRDISYERPFVSHSFEHCPRLPKTRDVVDYNTSQNTVLEYSVDLLPDERSFVATRVLATNVHECSNFTRESRDLRHHGLSMSNGEARKLGTTKFFEPFDAFVASLQPYQKIILLDYQNRLSCSYQEVTTQGGRDVGNAPSVPLT
ncbi:hypothetical protein G5I_03439 [Acromyrmex echinatior]|uniref:Uncharacterized protein n=1 Tax=Acromyrmex echinatior TaxID=103372 RepID=F4WD01_ACREC|nr:hypothetical protein G5I_03439 [Acromyrmex echinatior]